MEAIDKQLNGLTTELKVFASNVSSIKAANEQMQGWNKGFGRMILALDLLKQNQQQVEAVPGTIKESIVVDPVSLQIAEMPASKSKVDGGVGNKASARNAALKRKASSKAGARGTGMKRTKSRASAPKDRWSVVTKGLRKDLPKKYRDSVEQENRLKIVWRTVDAKPSVLGDIVKVCGCSVLQANECLSVLVKLKLIARKKEKTVTKFVSILKD